MSSMLFLSMPALLRKLAQFCDKLVKLFLAQISFGKVRGCVTARHRGAAVGDELPERLHKTLGHALDRRPLVQVLTGARSSSVVIIPPAHRVR